jgi:hypothetical protein
MNLTTVLELQSQTTRLCEHASYAASSRFETGFSPSLMPSSKGLGPGSHADHTSLGYNSERPAWITDSQLELIPLHSPLLGESLLVPFPPLNNMLKFRGSPRFISDLIREVCTKRDNTNKCTNTLSIIPFRCID